MSRAATVNYHVHKPERQAFELDAGGIAGNLISPELVPTSVDLTDMRKTPSAVTFAAEEEKPAAPENEEQEEEEAEMSLDQIASEHKKEQKKVTGAAKWGMGMPAMGHDIHDDHDADDGEHMSYKQHVKHFQKPNDFLVHGTVFAVGAV